MSSTKENKMEENKMEIVTNIYPYKISEEKATIGDVTIDVFNNMLSPFHQVDLFLSNLFTNVDNVQKNNDINANVYIPYSKKQTITSTIGKVTKGGKTKKSIKKQKKSKKVSFSM